MCLKNHFCIEVLHPTTVFARHGYKFLARYAIDDEEWVALAKTNRDAEMKALQYSQQHKVVSEMSMTIASRHGE